VGLVVAMTLLTVGFDGWRWEVDLVCLCPSWMVYYVIPVCWPDSRTSVYGSRGLYFPDVLRARWVGITLAGIACIIMREVYVTIGESIYPNPSFLSRDFPEASGRLLRNLKEFTFQDMAN